MNAQNVACTFADKLSRAGLLTEEDTALLCSVMEAKGIRINWTAKEDARLLALLDEEGSQARAAIRLGRTHQAVRDRLKRLRRQDRIRRAQSIANKHQRERG